MHMYFYVLCLLSFPTTIFTNQQLRLTSTNYVHHIHCHTNRSIQIHSIKYFYHKYNCTLVLHGGDENDETRDICLNQSSCVVNLNPFLFLHVQHPISECRSTKLKYIRLNYTCVNNTYASVNNLTQPKRTSTHTIILCFSIIILVSLLAFICSFFQDLARNDIQEHDNSLINSTKHIQSMYDNQNAQEFELNKLSLFESSSSSTLTSLNNQNIITNPSEYDNLIKNTYIHHPIQMISSRLDRHLESD